MEPFSTQVEQKTDNENDQTRRYGTWMMIIGGVVICLTVIFSIN